jgi:hypothetical protein
VSPSEDCAPCPAAPIPTPTVPNPVSVYLAAQKSGTDSDGARQALNTDEMSKAMIPLSVATERGITAILDKTVHFDEKSFAIQSADNKPAAWQNESIFVFKTANDKCATKDGDSANSPVSGGLQNPIPPSRQSHSTFKITTSRGDICAYGPKSLLDQLKIPE